MAVQDGFLKMLICIVQLVFFLELTLSDLLSTRLHAAPQETNLSTQEFAPQSSRTASKSFHSQSQKISLAGTAYSVSSEDAAQHKIKIVEPDGSVVKRISIVKLPLDRRANFDLQSIEKEPSFRVEQLGADGMLVLDLSNREEFLFMQTDMGCLLLASSRILATNQLDLLAWSKVRVRISHRDSPLANMKVTYSTTLTSDMMFQSPSISFSAIADDSGVAEFDRVPAGEACIKINPQPAEYNGQKWEWTDQTRMICTVPGQQMEVVIGRGARDVVGRFIYDREYAGLEEYWGANLEYSNTRYNMGGNSHTKIRIKISENGAFIAESAPPGEAKIIIQHPGVQPKGVGLDVGGRRIHVGPQRPFEQPRVVLGPLTIRDEGGNLEFQDLGDIKLDFKARQLNLVEPVTDVFRTEQSLVPINDEFTSREEIAFVASIKQGGETFVAFIDGKARVIRTPPEKPATPGRQAAFDPQRKRVYLVCENPGAAIRQELRAFNLHGRQLYTRMLDKGATYSIATDSDSGRIGLLESKSGKYAFQVLQPDGNSFLKRNIVSSQYVCYSSADKAFWLLGRSQITKLNATNLDVLSEILLPSKLDISSVYPLQTGGFVAIENSRSDTFTSANRIWKYNSQAQLTGVADLGPYVATSCMDFGKSLLVSGRKIKGLFSEEATQSCHFLIDATMENFYRFDVLPETTDSTGSAKSAWVLDGKMIKRVTGRDSSLSTTLSQNNDAGIVTIIAQPD
jgi:hypothetical protein